MTEILTESFCERCGTRYTFESSAPRKSRLGRVRMLSKGVRNFVMSDESSFSEAMAEARSEEELAATAHQLDAFHQTFNFCLTCRQYTCGDCWNTAEGRCLTCAPVPGQEEPAARFDLAAMAPVSLDTGLNGNGHEHGEPQDAEAWPETDLPTDRLARVLDLPVTEPVEAEASVEAEAPVEAEAQPQVLGVAPGQSLDEAIAAYEASLAAEEAATAPAPEPEAVGAMAVPEPAAVAALPEPEPVAQEPVPEPEPVNAFVEPEAAETVAPLPEPSALEAEPVAAAVEPEPVAAEPVAAEPVAAEPAAAEPVAAEPAAASEDHVVQPAWPLAPAPVAPAATAPTPTPAPAPAATPNPWLTVAPDDPSAPQWPVAPQWRTATPRHDVPLTLAGRPLLPQADTSALWAASAQEVLGAAPAPLASTAPAAAQPCVSCGLSLSANARFCRRCGSRQG